MNINSSQKSKINWEYVTIWKKKILILQCDLSIHEKKRTQMLRVTQKLQMKIFSPCLLFSLFFFSFFLFLRQTVVWPVVTIIIIIRRYICKQSLLWPCLLLLLYVNKDTNFTVVLVSHMLCIFFLFWDHPLEFVPNGQIKIR